MDVPIYDTQTWLNLVNNTRVNKAPLLKALAGFNGTGFDGGAIYTENNTIAWDEIVGDRNVPAPYTRRCGPSVPMGEPSVQTKSLPFPYIDIHESICCGVTSRRLPGTNGQQSAASRYAAELVKAGERLKASWQVALELQLRDILQTGKINIVGPNVQSQTLDFGRNAAHTVALTGGALWSAVTATPVANMQSWERLVTENGNTIGANWLFGFNALGAFMNSADVVKKFQTYNDKDLGTLKKNPLVARDSLNALGTFENRTIWSCNTTYRDPVTGLQVDLIDPNGVYVFGDFGLQPAFGKIENKKANFQSQDYFVWQKDCDKTDQVFLESAPLLIPTNVNGTFFAKVL